MAVTFVLLHLILEPKRLSRVVQFIDGVSHDSIGQLVPFMSDIIYYLTQSKEDV